jgi:hypothetical protein
VALTCAASVVSQGYLVGVVNHGLQLPLVRHFAGETTFSQDPFIQEMARTYTTAFFPLLGWASRVVDLPLLLLGFFLLFRFLTVLLGWRLGCALWGDSTAGLWTGAALSVQWLTFAQDVVSDTYLTHGALAQVMVLWSLLLLARGRVVWSFVVVGVLFNFHAMHAAHVGVVVSLAVLLGPRRGEQWRGWLLGGTVATLLTVPTLWWMVSSQVVGQPVPPGYVEGIRAWFPAHFWPSSWGAGDWLRLAMPVALGWPLWRLAGPSRDGGVVARVALVSLVLGVLGGLWAEVAASAWTIRLHPMRLSWLMTLAGLPMLARAAVALVRRLDEPGAPHPRVGSAAGVMLLLALSLTTLYRAPFLLALAPFLWTLALAKPGEQPPRRRVVVTVLATLACLVGPPVATLLSGAGDLSLTPRMEAVLHLFLAVEALVTWLAVGVILLGFLTRARGPWAGRGRRALFQVAVVVGLAHLGVRGAYMYNLPRTGILGDWVAVQRWCAQTLRPGEKVLVPLSQMGLRAFSNQTPAVDFQEGDALFHNPAYAEGYLRKLRLYGWEPGEIKGFGHISRLEPLDARMTPAKARELGAALGARVVVRRTRHPAWDLPEALRNASYVVYRLD